MRTLMPVSFLLLVTALPFADAQQQVCPPTLHQLKRMSECELDRLFENAPPGAIPLGYARGHMLLVHDVWLPRMQARMVNGVWKGKHFDENGDFINQWIAHKKALCGHAEQGVSWHDNKPSIVIEYPPNTPLFGNTRDELREIAPGMYLARLYEKCPCPRFKGYFVVQACCGR